jgi:hypothetical protein
MHGGDVSVSHRNAKADSVIRTSKDQFEGMIAGRVNAMSAALRGVVSLEGDPTLLVLFQRALPGPPSKTTGMDAFGRGRVDVEKRRNRGRRRVTSSRQLAAADRA